MKFLGKGNNCCCYCCLAKPKNAWENALVSAKYFFFVDQWGSFGSGIFFCHLRWILGVIQLTWCMWDSCRDQSSHATWINFYIPIKWTPKKFYFRTWNEEMFHFILHAKRATPNARWPTEATRISAGKRLVAPARRKICRTWNVSERCEYVAAGRKENF